MFHCGGGKFPQDQLSIYKKLRNNGVPKVVFKFIVKLYQILYLLIFVVYSMTHSSKVVVNRMLFNQSLRQDKGQKAFIRKSPRPAIIVHQCWVIVGQFVNFSQNCQEENNLLR